MSSTGVEYRDGVAGPGGRRPGESGTREAILAAARSAFAERGYSGTTIRAVATAAGVDPALVHHFFATKDGLFAASLALPASVVGRLPAVLDGDPATLGERLTRTYLTLWEDPASGPVLLAAVRSAVSHEEAGRLLQDHLGTQLLDRALELLPDDAPRLRIALAVAQLAGVALTRCVVRIDPIASAPLDVVVAAVAPSVQHYLTGDLALADEA